MKRGQHALAGKLEKTNHRCRHNWVELCRECIDWCSKCGLVRKEGPIIVTFADVKTQYTYYQVGKKPYVRLA